MSTTEEWDALSDERRRFEAKRMAVYGAMVEAMDFHIGRLVNHLKKTGQYDNTVFIFTSDNGAEASGPPDLNEFGPRRMTEMMGYRTDYETLGLKGSYNAISPSFASAAASPLAYYKFYVGEGGMRVPLIIAGEDLPLKGVLSHSFSFVTDITPTILSFAGVSPPAERHAGRPIEPIIGHNIRPVLQNPAAKIYAEDEAVGYELAGHAALFQGDYKIVFNRPPLGDGQWRLFNIEEDPGESRDLAQDMPQRLQKMLSAYETYKRENKVLPVPAGFDNLRQIAINFLYASARTPVLIWLLTLLLLLPFAIAYRMKNAHKEKSITDEKP